MSDSRDDGLDDHVFDLVPDQSGVDPFSTQVLPQSLQSPVHRYISTRLLDIIH